MSWNMRTLLETMPYVLCGCYIGASIGNIQDGRWPHVLSAMGFAVFMNAMVCIIVALFWRKK